MPRPVIPADFFNPAPKPVQPQESDLMRTLGGRRVSKAKVEPVKRRYPPLPVPPVRF